MKKITIKEEVFENIKTKVGETEKEVWETSDGMVWDNEHSAKYHEFYELKANKRGFYSGENIILDCESFDDIQRYIDDYGYNITVHNYNKDELVFPNTYVLIEHVVEGNDNGLGDSWHNYEVYLDIKSLSEYKKEMIEQLNSL